MTGYGDYATPPRAGRIIAEDGKLYNEFSNEVGPKLSDIVTVMDAASITTGTNSSNILLGIAGYDAAHVIVDADFPGSPTDNLVVYFYGSLDGINFDDTPFDSDTISNATDPNQKSYIFNDYAFIRARCLRSGSTDTITVTIKYRGIRYGKYGTAV